MLYHGKYDESNNLIYNIEIFDVIAEGQQFEFHGFELNPVIRHAIKRKVNL